MRDHLLSESRGPRDTRIMARPEQCCDPSDVLNELWRCDKNRLIPCKDYAICLQDDSTQSFGDKTSDKLSKRLFHFVNEQKLQNIKTYATFISLLEFSSCRTEQNQCAAEQEKDLVESFLDAVMATPVMEAARDFLVSRGLCPCEPCEFKQQLREIWFSLCNRDSRCRSESTAFEHVFIGKTRTGEAIPFHNWLQFYLQEKQQNVVYQSYSSCKKNCEKPDEEDQLINLQFLWCGHVTALGSTFVGTSPEFEFALYTLCLLLSRPRTSHAFHVSIDAYRLQIVVRCQGSALCAIYPVLLEVCGGGSGVIVGTSTVRMQQLQVTTQADTAETPAPLVVERKKRGGSGRRTTDEQSHRVQACRITAYATQGTRVGQGFAKACADSVTAVKSTEVSASAEESVGCPPPQNAEAPDSLPTTPIISDVLETSSGTKGFCGSPCSSPKPQRVQTPPPCDLPSTKPTPCSLSPVSIPGPHSSSPKPAHQSPFKSAQQDLPSPMNAQPPCGSPKFRKASPCHSPKTSQAGSPKLEPCTFDYPCKGDTVSPQTLSHVAQQHGKQAHHGIGHGAMDTFLAGLGANQRSNTAVAGHGYPGWRSRTTRGTGKRRDVLNASRLCHSILKFQPSYHEAVRAVCTNRDSNSAAPPGEALAGTSAHAPLPRKVSESFAVGSKFVASSRRQSCGRSTDAATEFNRAVSSAQATLAAPTHPGAQADAAFGKRERVLTSHPCYGGAQYLITTTNRRASIGDMYARSGAILGRLGRENFTQGHLQREWCGTRNMHMPAAAMTLQRSRSHHSTGPITTTFPHSWCGPGCCHCRTESLAFRSQPGARCAQPWLQQEPIHKHLHTCYH